MTREEKFLAEYGYYPGMRYQNGIVTDPVQRLHGRGFIVQPDAGTKEFYNTDYYTPFRENGPSLGVRLP